MTIKQSKRREIVSQSEIRAMTRECQKVDGINMAQGICDLDVPPCVIEGAKDAMDTGHNIYTSCQGMSQLRQAISGKMKKLYGMEVDPENEVLVSIGATGAFYSVCLALLDPGDEVILLEPFYGYHDATLAAIGCKPRYVRLDPPDWTFDMAALESVITERTRAIVLNTPSNPAGKVFTRLELEMISDFAETHDLVVFTDEIYEHFVYDGFEHLPPAMIPGMRERTITISGFSKVFSITGWRLGYAVCPPDVVVTASHLNDLVYVCAPSPLQLGAVRGVLELGPEYYAGVSEDHLRKRDQFCMALSGAGLTPFVPRGSYYVLADISRVPGNDDKERVMHILQKTGVASVPGRAFYHDNAGRDLARFCFAKKQNILDEACERIQDLLA
ncbi:pyridoxal phosphate-dependent aminotransferase [Verrucomicrobiota bacterium]